MDTSTRIYTVPYADLDPGIREVVRLLQSWSYVTTDSGDGVSKPQDEDTRPYPHVTMRVTGATQAIYLVKRLAGVGIRCVSVTEAFMSGDRPSAPCMQFTYDPVDGIATLDLMGLDDAMLAKGSVSR
jgi:hypothetical protein